MTSLDIIERLLDQRSISAKEAMIILKDLAKIGTVITLPNTVDDIYIEDAPQTITWSSNTNGTVKLDNFNKINAQLNSNYTYGKKTS